MTTTITPERLATLEQREPRHVVTENEQAELTRVYRLHLASEQGRPEEAPGLDEKLVWFAPGRDGAAYSTHALLAELQKYRAWAPKVQGESVPRPLAIRNGVADLMVDELAKQYQKARCYGSIAQKWRAEALRLGSQLPHIDGDPCDDALKFARGVLANAWEQQGETEREPQPEPEPGNPTPKLGDLVRGYAPALGRIFTGRVTKLQSRYEHTDGSITVGPMATNEDAAMSMTLSTCDVIEAAPSPQPEPERGGEEPAIVKELRTRSRGMFGAFELGYAEARVLLDWLDRKPPSETYAQEETRLLRDFVRVRDERDAEREDGRKLRARVTELEESVKRVEGQLDVEANRADSLQRDFSTASATLTKVRAELQAERGKTATVIARVRRRAAAVRVTVEDCLMHKTWPLPSLVTDCMRLIETIEAIESLQPAAPNERAAPQVGEVWSVVPGLGMAQPWTTCTVRRIIRRDALEDEYAVAAHGLEAIVARDKLVRRVDAGVPAPKEPPPLNERGVLDFEIAVCEAHLRKPGLGYSERKQLKSQRAELRERLAKLPLPTMHNAAPKEEPCKRCGDTRWVISLMPPGGMVPCPDCAADKKEHARADKTTTEQPKENPNGKPSQHASGTTEGNADQHRDARHGGDSPRSQHHDRRDQQRPEEQGESTGRDEAARGIHVGRPGKYDRLKLTTGPTAEETAADEGAKAVEAGHHVERLTREELDILWRLEELEKRGVPERGWTPVDRGALRKLLAAAERDLSSSEQPKPGEP